MLIGKSNIFARLLTICTTALIFSCSAAVSDSSLDLDKEIDTFVKVLVEKDEAKLVTDYLTSSASFSKEGKLNSEIYDFLYKADANGKKKSVNEIVSLGDYKTKVIWQKNNVFTLLIAKAIDFKSLETLEFLENSWMINYISCEFVIKSGKLTFYQNVCFAETGGPFPTDVDF